MYEKGYVAKQIEKMVARGMQDFSVMRVDPVICDVLTDNYMNNIRRIPAGENTTIHSWPFMERTYGNVYPHQVIIGTNPGTDIKVPTEMVMKAVGDAPDGLLHLIHKENMERFWGGYRSDIHYPDGREIMRVGAGPLYLSAQDITEISDLFIPMRDTEESLRPLDL